ncbi:putative 2-hydroxyacid dehydrogenase UNK4.10 [Beauveria bassiana]|uniref:Glyoxylate reductase n=1 Tax=Beauveria bassiana (strain ARSEF 2860) TaxID=655819 RepID=J4UT03_BEAB2|nr:glyoxylate reductase [Beauveria bassiana ARSEF 2860]EJP68867.1 glyoxylate reductase [Beauveria bassiana ARSEF 2860]KAH8720433.1 putative 2-hydroxyacid dehydrogenase UNK4.10 [Beauveria bassiana]
MATAATAEMLPRFLLPRFLLPRLSWQPATAPRRLVAAAIPPLAARQLQQLSHARRPRISSARSDRSSPILSRAFHASAPRARDHHFDTLKFVKRLRDEGFTEEQSVAMMKVLSDVIEESIQNLTRTMVLREDSAKATYTQKVDFAKLRSELLSADSTETNTTRGAHERLSNDIAKLGSRLRDEVARTQASVRLDLNLEKGRIREEALGQELKIKETETKIEQEVAALREKLEQVKFQTLQWLMGVCTGFAAVLLGAWRLLIAHDALASVAQIGGMIQPTATNRADFLAECQSEAFSGVEAIFRTYGSARITGLFDEELVSALPKSCRFVCHKGAGYDQIDVAACRARGIRVSNTPTAVDEATADVTLFLILGTLRNLNVAMKTLRQGTFRGASGPDGDPARLPALGHDPQGKVLGILGMGGIGRSVAAKARVFGMKIRYYNRNRLAAENEAGAEYVDFATLLAESDVLSLNLPLNPKTRHIISTKEFGMMKRGIVIVNTARGAVMDEAALVEALDRGIVSSAGLDVFEHEPEVHPGLLANDKVMLVPHMGTWTEETETKMEEWALDNVRLALQQGRLKSIVPEQKDMQ